VYFGVRALPDRVKRAFSRVLVACLLTSARSMAIHAQEPSLSSSPLSALCAELATAGSSVERDLLVAALLVDSTYSTLLRPLSGDDARGIMLGLARRTGAMQTESQCDALLQPASAQLWYNATAARQDRDGGVWQGRGISAALSAGLRVRKGLFTLSLRPLGFASENKAYAPRPEPLTQDDLRYPFWGRFIDLPYRFGHGAYVRLLPGESFAQLAWKHASLGATTASQHWGPMHLYPLLIGTESQGYPRAFIEAREVAAGGIRLTGHWHVGVLEASPYTTLQPGDRSRVASAFTASVRAAAFELGAGRFFHLRRTPGALNFTTATLPFSGLLKNRSTDTDLGGYNQLASLFFRVAPAAAGVEVYGEFLRDDHNANTRDLIGEPDQSSAYGVGVRRAWLGNGGLTAITLEYANARISHLTRVRTQVPIYTHDPLTEGHTYEGQALGSSAIVNGGGMTVQWSSIAQATSTDIAVAIEPAIQDGEGGTWNGGKSGSYMLRAGQSRSLPLGVFGIVVEVRLGYGEAGRGGAALGMTWR
jgi:hypothetical protein